MDKNIEINTTHICVLKKDINKDELFLDYIKLEFEYQKDLDILKKMPRKTTQDFLNLNNFINKKLSILLDYFDYCKYLQATYQGLKEIIINKNDTIEESSNNLIKEIETRAVAYTLKIKYEACQNDANILAFSHRKVGWASPEFKLSNNIYVSFLTNYGYGQSSYSYTKVRYMDIDITPYSNWISYRFANKHTIIRYTYHNIMDNYEWPTSMKLISEMYKCAVTDTDLFIKKYIIDEVNSMVKGLDNIVSSEKQYIIDKFSNNSNFIECKNIQRPHQNQIEKIEGRDLVEFKSEKIAGSLDFIDSIKKLESLNYDIHYCIGRILFFNTKVYPLLIKEIEIMRIELELSEIKLKKISPIYFKNKIAFEIFEKIDIEYNKNQKLIINEYLEEKKKETSNLDYTILIKDCDNSFFEKYPNYNLFKERYVLLSNKLNRIKENYNRLTNETNSLKFRIQQFEKYQQTIYKYFQDHNRSQELIA